MLSNSGYICACYVLMSSFSQSCCEEIKQVKSNSEGWIIVEEAVVAQCEESMPTQLGYFSLSLILKQAFLGIVEQTNKDVLCFTHVTTI